jgi:hypothetical protein
MAINVRPSIVTSGLVLNLDAANMKSYPRSGTTWRDLSGNNYSGSLTNGPTFNNQNGGSIVFDGVDDYTDLGLVTQLTNITNLSVNAWVYPITSSYIAYVSRYSNTTPSNGWLLASYTGLTVNSVKFSFDGRESTAQYISVTSSIELPINNWVNVIGTKSSSTWSIYVNGLLQGSIVTGSGATNFQNNNLQVGALIGAGFSVYSRNRVALTQIYNRALTPTEVQQNYNATKTRFGLQ